MNEHRMQREEQQQHQEQQQQRTVESRTHEAQQRLGTGHTSIRMDESVGSETATRTRRGMCECPSETTSVSARSSRVSWRRPKQELKPIQEWSKSRPKSFHRDDRVLYIPKEETTVKTPSSQVINDTASDAPSAATAISTSTAMRRGMTQQSFNRSNTTLTKQQLEKHMRHANHITPLSGKAGIAGVGNSTVGWDWEYVPHESYEGGAVLDTDQHNQQQHKHKSQGTRQEKIDASTNNKGDIPTPTKGTSSDQSADEEEELVARFYAEQHARLHKSVPKVNPEAQPSPSPGNDAASTSNVQQLSNADQPQQQQQEQTNASVQPNYTVPLHSTNEQPSTTTSQTNTSQHETQTLPPTTSGAPHVTTLEDFRQQVIQKKQKQVESTQEQSANKPFTTQLDTFTTTEHHETGTQEQEIVINIEDDSLQQEYTNTDSLADPEEKDSHRSAVLSAGQQEEHLLASEMALSADEQRERAVIAEEEESHRSAVLSAGQREEQLLAIEMALSADEQRERAVIAEEEEYHRSAVLSAGQREEHLLAGEMALSAEEQRMRAVIAEEEEYHRSAVLSAVTVVSPASGIKGDVGRDENVGLIREDNTVAEWPSRRAFGNETSVGEVVIGRDDSLAGVPAVSSINLVSLHDSEREVNSCAVVDSVQLQDDCRVGAGSQNVSTAAVDTSHPPLHPALATGDRTPLVLPHGSPLGVDRDEVYCEGEYEARRSYSWWSCLLTPFSCCRSRHLLQEEEMARRGDDEHPLVEE